MQHGWYKSIAHDRARGRQCRSRYGDEFSLYKHRGSTPSQRETQLRRRTRFVMVRCRPLPCLRRTTAPDEMRIQGASCERNALYERLPPLNNVVFRVCLGETKRNAIQRGNYVGSVSGTGGCIGSRRIGRALTESPRWGQQQTLSSRPVSVPPMSRKESTSQYLHAHVPWFVAS